MQKEAARYFETFQRAEDLHDPLLSGRQPYFSNLALDNVSLSPRQMAQDERRTSFQALPPKPNFFRPPAPPHLSISPRRYGSIGNNTQSPSFRHVPNAAPPQPPTQHPLASVTEPGVNLGRRHTSADIRDTAGWPPNGPGIVASPFEAGPQSSSTANWPPSPQVRTPNASDQHVRDVLASYSLGQPRRQPDTRNPQQHNAPAQQARQPSPPPPSGDVPPNGVGPTENGFTFREPRFGGRLMESAPQTRRSSMASNVHNLLNPAESGEREDEDGNDDRKRKRV